MNPLLHVGNIEIPASVIDHRFVVEALSCTQILQESADERGSLETIIGTKNKGSVELYGWARNVLPHVDDTGMVYFVALNAGRSLVHVGASIESKGHSVWLRPGKVIRLNDFTMHWTEDDQPRVCAFVGSFEEPCDRLAIGLLQEAVNKLAAGTYYDAPRVRPGFQVLLEDECMVPDWASERCNTMLLADAQAKGLDYERCALCENPASRLDRMWPYHSEFNRCFAHLCGEKK